jgi:hypothetical protein
MENLTSMFLTLIFTSLSVLHFYWAFSGKQVSSAVLPSKDGQKVLKPSLFGTLVVAVGLLVFAMIAAQFHSEFAIEQIDSIHTVAAWLIALIFLFRVIGDFKYVGAFRKIKNTAFAKNDRLYFTPLCFLLSAGMFFLLNQ